jgi:DNA-binding response OmpR family regulator
MIPKKILIVEDDTELAKLTAEYLSSFGYTVVLEENGNEAVNRIKLEKPDLVILDIMLPGKDGIEICRSNRKY